jgi:hypothetical protein
LPAAIPETPIKPDPRQIIVQAWKEVEDYLEERWRDEYTSAPDKKYFISARTRMRMLSGRTRDLLMRLLDARNKALMDLSEPITEAEAEHYKKLVKRVLALMEDPHEPYGGPPQHEPQ